MKSIIFAVLITLSLSVVTGCSSSRNLSADNVIKNSIWINLTPSEFAGEKGVVINSLFFTSDNKVIMKTGVGQGSKIIATPVFSNFGTYTCSGNLKDGIIIKIDSDVATIGKKINYEGFISPEGMMLIEPDSTAYFYYQLQTQQK